jgi:hypothetical protein
MSSKWLFSAIYFLTTILLVSKFTTLEGQINFPKISPKCVIQQQIGLSEIEVIYSRPSMRGREIMGSIIPYGRIWRVGANESTKFRISDDATINGKHLPKGEYALYAFPEKEEWTIVFHKNTTHWGDGRKKYDPAEDALRIQVKPTRITEGQESFQIGFDNFTHQSTEMQWKWEYTQIAFIIAFDTHAKVMQEIDEQMKANPTANTYYQSARYLQEQSLEPNQAKVWLQKAHELAGDKYYIHRVRSLVEAQLGNYTLAIQHAQKSKQIAEELGKDEFVRMNETNIQRWLSLKDSTNK